MMRIYGRQTDPVTGAKSWATVETDSAGFNDQVYLTALCQGLQLNTGESPFYANTGIPQQQTVVTQVFPDFYVMQMQTQYAPFFASLTMNKISSGTYEPYYRVDALAHSGAQLGDNIPI